MRALVIGRFQPFHLGHLKMLEYVAAREEAVVVGVGSSNRSRTIDNPFTAEERMEMIRNSVSFRNFVLVGIPDMNDNSKWVGWIRDNLDFKVVYTNSNNEREIFISAGFKVKRIPFFNREKYSAVEVRKRIIGGCEWESLVPQGTLEVMDRIKGAQRIRNLSN